MTIKHTTLNVLCFLGITKFQSKQIIDAFSSFFCFLTKVPVTYTPSNVTDIYSSLENDPGRCKLLVERNEPVPRRTPKYIWYPLICQRRLGQLVIESVLSVPVLDGAGATNLMPEEKRFRLKCQLQGIPNLPI